MEPSFLPCGPVPELPTYVCIYIATMTVEQFYSLQPLCPGQYHHPYHFLHHCHEVQCASVQTVYVVPNNLDKQPKYSNARQREINGL